LKTIKSGSRSYIPVIGFKNFASKTPDLLNGGPLRFTWISRPSIWPLHFPSAAALYQHGGGPLVPSRLFAACRFFNRPIIKHWLGSDVLRAASPLVQAQNASGQIIHWANSPWLAAELAQAGIAARTVSNLGTDGAVLPMPAAPLTVLTFLPKFDFYGGRDVLALARALPEVRFLVVAAKGDGWGASSNVEFLGYRTDMPEVYARCHVLLRMPKHDGKSRMVCEALAFGRHVVWNYPMVGARLALTRPLAAALLRRLEDDLRAGRLEPNQVGSEYIATHESSHVVREQILTAMMETIEAWPAQSARRGERAAFVPVRSQIQTQ